MARTTIRVRRLGDGSTGMLRLEEEAAGAHACEWRFTFGELEIDRDSLALLLAARAGGGDPPGAVADGLPTATPGGTSPPESAGRPDGA
jgi:hypothetical protein